MNPVSRFTFGFIVLLLTAMAAQAQLIISEFMADNKNTLTDVNGAFSDWIEIYNTSFTNVNLAGWSLTDDSTHQARWFFPATNLTAKGFMVVFASGTNRAVAGAQLHADFSLKASGEYLALLKPNASVATEFAPSFPAQSPDISYGSAQDATTNTFLTQGSATRVLVPSGSGLGSTWTQTGFDDSSWGDAISGVGYQTTVPGFAVYNYQATVAVNDINIARSVITNPAQQSAVYSENAALINYINTGSSGHYTNDRQFPGFTSVDQNDFVVEATALITIPTAGNWTFGVNSDDGFGLSISSFAMTFASPRGPGDTLQTFNIPAPGTYPFDLVYFERGGGSEVEVFAAQGSFTSWDSTNFRLVGDTANGGLTVNSTVVSGGGAANYNPFINTDVQGQMNGINATAYLRSTFDVPSPSALQSLNLRMMYDDGFIAYLNGQLIAQRNAPVSPQWNSGATTPHPNPQALVFEDINLTDHLNALQPGANVLAIQGLNQAASDGDFLILPQLLEYRVTNTTARFFSTPTPGGINSAGFVAFVADTKFSFNRGFYNAPFSLSITTATASASIIYTSNGSTPSLTNGFTYSGPLAINGTTVIRAAAFKNGFLPSNVDTETYLFTTDIIHQAPTGVAPTGWPASWGGNVVDYGMDPDVVNNALYSSTLTNDLKSIPCYSIVTDLPNLFDPAFGIYANPGQDGIEWERPASIELIYPDNTQGFHINAGLRIRGGFSRNTANPKHAFRFFFRSEYGAGKLDFPAFANQGGAGSFDGFDFRTFENYSWSFQGDYRFIALRDQFSRDTQIAQGQPAERGDFYNLFINGQYWGLYNTCERAEASYGASYFGGNKEDYDVIKVDSALGQTINATDGNKDAWTRLWMAATNGFANDSDYFKVQGRNVDGTPNLAFENLIEIDNLIDYMLVIFFTGNIDAPISQFVNGNAGPNNFYGVRSRTGLRGGFRFFCHDSEHSLLHESSLATGELYRDRTGPFPAGDPVQQGPVNGLANSNPQYFFTRLIGNAEFRLRVADRIHKQFFNGGVLTTGACRARLITRSNEIYSAVVGESARWGDAKRGAPFTRNAEWVTEMNRVYGDYFAQRPAIVLTQLQAKALYPTSSAAPSFSQFGGNVANGYPLTLSVPAGIIYYTLDGSDPRLRGGGIAPAALVYSGPLTLGQSVNVKARTLNGAVWSALADATFYIIRDFTSLLITEIMYHPVGLTNLDGDAFEFVELKNVASTNLELSGLHFTEGIDFTFPVGSFVAPGHFIVLVNNPAGFTNRYPGLAYHGVYSGKLSNSGEDLRLAHASGATLFALNYGTRSPWPSSPDGTGFSLVPVNPNLNPDPSNPANWRASSTIGGSPGTDDLSSNIPAIRINEALTHTDPPQLDSIELFNPNPTNVDIGNWYLTDNRTVPLKFRIPAPKVIIANSYLIVTEDDWNPGSTNNFRLDSHGEEIYLYSADSNGNLTGFSDGFAFGAARNGVSFGRYIISTGEPQYPAQSVNTLGASNAGPRVGPVVINEIQYHPAAGGEEFIELKNLNDTTVKLFDPAFPTNTWHLNGVGFSFPMNTQIAPTGMLLVVKADPAAFRIKYGVPAAVPVFGPYSGSLQGGGETISLQFPDAPDLNTNTGIFFVPYIDEDVVHYDNKPPWPTNADGSGASLERINSASYGNDPINWRSSVGGPSPGQENLSNHVPVVYAGPDQVFAISNTPVAVHLLGSATDDGMPNPPGSLTVGWTQSSGPSAGWINNSNQANTTAYLPGIGTYVFRLTANDGATQVSDDVTFTLQRSVVASQVTFVSKGVFWKYLDNGSNQGTGWSALGFPDSSWVQGTAPLGYGDANGQFPATTNSYGPNANNKYVTTYYRRGFNVSNAASVSNLVVNVQRDDGVIVYLNGTPVFTNNMPAAPITYLTYASAVIGGVDETTFYSQSVPSSLLVNGLNVLASEIHQANSNSSDLIFDSELVGDTYPPNQAPAVNAGPNQSITLPAIASLNGTVTDDGLPVPPGLLTLGWSKLSGPGTVTFANSNTPATTASFSSSGTYVLKLTGNDGMFETTNYVTITAFSELPPLHIDLVERVAGPPPKLHLAFTAIAGVHYMVQYKGALNSGSWLTLADVPSQPTTQTIEVFDPIGPGTRYYRIIAPP
jgi:hypothetical protein